MAVEKVETRWVEYEGLPRFCTIDLRGNKHAWFDTFGDTICAYCGIFVWDEEAKEICNEQGA